MPGFEGDVTRVAPLTAASRGVRDINIGRMIGKYRLTTRVGEGGMGSVYAAERADHEFQKLAAVKLVRPGLMSEEYLRRFRTERQALAALDHPNIGRLLDGGTTDDGLPYLVMEFVEGEQIDRYCNFRQLGIEERLKLFCGVCSAVQYAHQNLIVHRDLKPNNILVTADGTPKLLDFGIAKLLNPEFADQTNITRAEVAPMTPEYASPEQVRGDVITTSTDVYALGVLLYVLLTGRHPFRANSLIALEKAVLMDTPEAPSTAVRSATPDFVKRETLDKVSRKLRGDLDAIVLTALRKEPLRRYASVERFAEDIRNYLAGRPISARKDTLAYRASKFARRHTAGVAATATAVLALIASSVIAIRSAHIADLERVQAERRFNEVRQFAHFVLFDLDSAIRSGATAARKTVVQEALKYLDSLERDANGDPGLERELASAYLKVGDLQGNLYLANVGEPDAARRSYDNAYRIAKALAATHPDDIEARREAAEANVRIANPLSLGANRDEAVRRYEEARSEFEKLAPRDPQSRRDLMDVWSKIGMIRLQLANPRGALDAYQQSLRIAQEIAASDNSPGSRRAVAYGNERVGYAMARAGSTDAGLARLRQALAEYRRLLADAPDRAAAGRDIESTEAVVGDILWDAQKPTEAVESYRGALAIAESLANSDPNNEQFKRDRIVMLGRLAETLPLAGKAAEAHTVAQQAVVLLKPMIAAPDASDPDLIEYCVLLIALGDRSKGPEAVGYAQRLVEHTKGQDPVMLDVLGRAWDLSGDAGRAIATAQKALALLQGGASRMRSQVETHLAAFRSHALNAKP